MNVISEDSTVPEDPETRDAYAGVQTCVYNCLAPREEAIITMRYGLDDKLPHTQREIAYRGAHFFHN